MVFPANTQIRFHCDASANDDHSYIDQVTVTGSNSASQSQGPSNPQTCELIALSQTGLDATELDNYLIIYPVPATNELTVATSETVQALRIYNMNGTIVKQFGAMKNANKLDISDLKPGIDLAAFVTGEETATRKFVKK